MNPPAITCLDAQTAVRRSFQEDRADIEADDRFRTFFDLESAHEGILCRNIATIPQENNRREDNFSVFSKILTRDGCCAPAAKTEVIWRQGAVDLKVEIFMPPIHISRGACHGATHAEEIDVA